MSETPEILVLYVTTPTADGVQWYVWDTYHPDEPARFVGSMEDCYLVADTLNKENLKRKKETA